MVVISSSSRTGRTGVRTGFTCTTRTGALFSLPAGWTDVAAADPFVVIAAGRCPFTADGLLAVADLADRLRAQRDGGQDVKTIMP